MLNKVRKSVFDLSPNAVAGYYQRELDRNSRSYAHWVAERDWLRWRMRLEGGGVITNNGGRKSVRNGYLSDATPKDFVQHMKSSIQMATMWEVYGLPVEQQREAWLKEIALFKEWHERREA